MLCLGVTGELSTFFWASLVVVGLSPLNGFVITSTREVCLFFCLSDCYRNISKLLADLSIASALCKNNETLIFYFLDSLVFGAEAVDSRRTL